VLRGARSPLALGIAELAEIFVDGKVVPQIVLDQLDDDSVIERCDRSPRPPNHDARASPAARARRDLGQMPEVGLAQIEIEAARHEKASALPFTPP
jgi:hypothetical protein